MKLNRAQLLALNLDSHIVVDAGAGGKLVQLLIEDRALSIRKSESH